MIHPNVIKRKADDDRLSAPVVERDCVLTHVLTALTRDARQRRMVFKGGTALRLCHFDDYRYSADLDFSLVGELDAAEAIEAVRAALAECRDQIGLPVLRLTDGNPPRIEYVGPLEAKPRNLKLDLATDELVEETVDLPVARRYEDQDNGRCTAYTLDEVAAEKLRCVMQRLQCRDLFDLHELLAIRGVDAASIWPAFERKARHRDRDPGRFAEVFERRVDEWSQRWDTELLEYLAEYPHFQETVRAVRRELRFALR